MRITGNNLGFSISTTLTSADQQSTLRAILGNVLVMKEDRIKMSAFKKQNGDSFFSHAIVTANLS